MYRESIILFRNLDLEISTEITVSKKLYKKILDPQIWFLDIRFYVQNFYDRSDSNLLAIRSIPSLPRIKYSSLSTIDNIFLCSTILNQIKMKVTCSTSLATRLLPSLLKIFRSINQKRGWNRFFSAILSNLRALQKNRENGTNLILRSEEKYYANNSSSEQSINFPSKIRVSMYYKIIPIRRTKKEKKTSIIRISKDKIEFLQTRIIEFFFSLDKKDSSSFHR